MLNVLTIPKDIRYAAIKPRDCRKVADLHRAVFPREKVARTIYGSRRIHHYLASLVELTDFTSQHVLWGAWIGPTLAGYFHARQLERNWHLNEIATLPSHQGKGIGCSLFRKWTEFGQTLRCDAYSLDVIPDGPAYQWYLRQGFEKVQATWTYEKQLPLLASPRRSSDLTSNSRNSAIEVSDWENAQAWQRSYGFSRFGLAYEGKNWSIGRFGEKYFRVNEPLPLIVERALTRIGSQRRLLITSTKVQGARELKCVGISMRMAKDRST